MLTNGKPLSVFAVLAFAVLSACSDESSHDLTAPRAPRLASGQSASTFTTNEVIPFGFTALECGFEPIEVSGRLHLVMHGTITSSGHVNAVGHVNPQNIRGFGLTTGTKYLAPGMLQTATNMNGPAPLTDTFVNNFHLIGQGDAPDFLFHQNLHLTVNANGDVTAVVDNTNFECKS